MQTAVVDIHLETKGKCIASMFLMMCSSLHKLYTQSFCNPVLHHYGRPRVNSFCMAGTILSDNHNRIIKVQDSSLKDQDFDLKKGRVHRLTVN